MSLQAFYCARLPAFDEDQERSFHVQLFKNGGCFLWSTVGHSDCSSAASWVFSPLKVWTCRGNSPLDVGTFLEHI